MTHSDDDRPAHERLVYREPEPQPAYARLIARPQIFREGLSSGTPTPEYGTVRGLGDAQICQAADESWWAWRAGRCAAIKLRTDGFWHVESAAWTAATKAELDRLGVTWLPR